MVLDTLKPILDTINKFIPDGAEKNRLQADLERVALEVDKERLGALKGMLSSNSFFVSGAIPAILWILVLSVFNNYILMPWVAVFGKTIPNINLPDEFWTLVGWIVTGLLAKKAVDGNAFYSSSGALLKPSRSEENCNTFAGATRESMAASKSQPTRSSSKKTQEVLPNDRIGIEPDAEIVVTKDDKYYEDRWAQLSNQYGDN